VAKNFNLQHVNKKYFPFIALIAAVLLFVWVQYNKRGGTPKRTKITTEAEAVPFVRDSTKLIYSAHAKCRMACRHIDESEVNEILRTGEMNAKRTETNSKGTSYALEGTTHDNQDVRIVYAPKNDKIVVVTVIDLQQEWDCNCE
jgi:hypothetical protein